MTDQQLIEGCQQGKAKYQKMLLEKHAASLMSVARRYSRCEEDAKDHLQEGWISIFKALDKYEFHSEPLLRGWMRKIVVNICLKKYQKNKRRENLSANIIPIDTVVKTTVLDQMTVDEILKLIERLPYPSNVVFKLSVIEGYKHKEISEMLGMAESTSRVHLTNARAKMKKYFPEFKELINYK